MTLNITFIIQKLELFNNYIIEIDEILRQFSDELLLCSKRDMSALERMFQLATDAMIDINQHFIRELEITIPDDLYNTFIKLGEQGVIPIDFAVKIAPITSIRNRLVHDYEKINQELFIRNLRENFGDFTTYRKFILKYLETETQVTE